MISYCLAFGDFLSSFWLCVYLRKLHICPLDINGVLNDHSFSLKVDLFVFYLL